jgi:hypothetical protein
LGLTTLPCKKKIVEKPPRNSVGFCGGAKERRKKKIYDVSKFRGGGGDDAYKCPRGLESNTEVDYVETSFECVTCPQDVPYSNLDCCIGLPVTSNSK